MSTQKYIIMNKMLLLIGFGLVFCVTCMAKNNPRVFIFTDINIDAGDPDDRQSLIHLLWYANELQGFFRVFKKGGNLRFWRFTI